MKTKSEYPTRHASEHLPWGSDPIPGLGEGGGGGIMFDTYPQDGNWLYLKTTDSGTSPNGWGIEIQDDSGDGIRIESSYRVGVVGGFGLTLTAGGAGGVAIAGNPTTISANPFQVTASSQNKIDITVGTHFNLDSSWGYLHMDNNGIRLQTPGPSLDIVSLAGGQVNMAGGSLSLSSSGASDAAVLITATGTASLFYNMIPTGGVYGGVSSPGHYVALPSGSIFEVWTGMGGTPILTVNNTTGTPTYHIKTGASWVADL